MKNIFFTIILFLIISSCTTPGDGEPDFDKEIYKGTLGVVLDIQKNKLPNEVFENEEFNYVIRVENKGVYPVTNSRLVIGFEKGFIQSSTTPNSLGCSSNDNIFICNSIKLEGKDYFADFHDFQVIEVPLKVKELDKLSEYHDTYVFTNFCYDYKGIAYTNVCIDTDPHNINMNEKQCEGGESLSLSQGQGGPVIIDRIETRMYVENDKLKPQFKIYIVNGGQGTVFKSGSVDSVCNNNELERDVYNSVNLVALEFSNYNLNDFECLPKELKLRNEEDFVVCTLKTGISKSIPTYQTPLKVEIEYGYIESFSKEIKIKKIMVY